VLDYHAQTKHSYASVRSRGGGMDWDNKPDVFKRYPSHFERFFLDQSLELHRFFHRIGGVSATKTYPNMRYCLRTNPSAGALYPTEVYVQIRSMEGFKDGLYHLCPEESSLVLIHPLSSHEGVERALHVNAFHGCIFLFSTLYFRSSWKYKNRAFRYCLQDTGHMLGTLEASCFLLDKPYNIIYDLDKKALNTSFGFGAEEFFLSAALVGQEGTHPTQLPTKPLAFVDGTKHFEANPLIEEAYAQSLSLSHPFRQKERPLFALAPEPFERVIMERRSTREFYENAITQEDFETIMTYVSMPIPSDADTKVHIYALIHRVVGMEQGVWLEGHCIKSGDFAKLSGHLCLDQALGSQSAVTFFLLSNDENYQALMQKSGILGHRLYLIANMLGIGCSGIGAYYDDEVTDFLETDAKVLYALAIGK